MSVSKQTNNCRTITKDIQMENTEMRLEHNAHLSLVMRKPAFCICENKDADQLRGNREADQRLVFATRIVQSLYYLNPKFQASSHLLWLSVRFMLDLGGNPEDRFSHNEAHLKEDKVLKTLTE